MSEATLQGEITLTPFDNNRLINLCGRFDEHLRLIEKRLDVQIINRGNVFQILGEDSQKSDKAIKILKHLYERSDNRELTPQYVHMILQEHKNQIKPQNNTRETQQTEMILKTPMGTIRPRTMNQMQYVQNILKHDVTFGIGPAGTGKTYLAVACGVHALQQEQVKRILLVRPAVEAGEKLGFLPGDLSEKIDPYLKPLYDALYEMLGPKETATLLEQQVIELAPLAFMRGRTLNDSFIILDEGQNTTIEQMKMFLTRIGFSSTAVITGDITQIDLPKHVPSGLKQVIEVLKDVKEISFSHLCASDVVRHPVVQHIIDAYQQYDQKMSPH